MSSQHPSKGKKIHVLGRFEEEKKNGRSLIMGDIKEEGAILSLGNSRGLQAKSYGYEHLYFFSTS
jgi:hypothetical protein